MGTLSTVIRNEMLDVIDGFIGYVDLVAVGQPSNNEYTFNRVPISFESASGGEKEQEETVTFVENVTGTDEEVIVTGFRFWNDDTQGGILRGEGEFEESVSLLVGNEYTINISGIKITLPE